LLNTWPVPTAGKFWTRIGVVTTCPATRPVVEVGAGGRRWWRWSRRRLRGRWHEADGIGPRAIGVARST
jgi:hypothetical protein